MAGVAAGVVAGVAVGACGVFDKAREALRGGLNAFKMATEPLVSLIKGA